MTMEMPASWPGGIGLSRDEDVEGARYGDGSAAHRLVKTRPRDADSLEGTHEAEEVAQREEPEHSARGAGQGFRSLRLGAGHARGQHAEGHVGEAHETDHLTNLAGHEIVVDDFLSAQKVVRARGEETEDGEGEAIRPGGCALWRHRVREFRAQCVGMGAPRSASRAW